MLTPLFVGSFLCGISVTAQDPAITVPAGALGFLAMLDAFGRYQEYSRCVRELQGFPDLTRMIARHKGTHCQRQALVLAALCVSPIYFKYINGKLRSMGYRWWHVFPDWMTRRPSTVLRRRFWVAFLGFRRQA